MFPEVVIFLKSTPREAMDFLELNQVDLILLDLNLPEMSGWEIIGLLKENSIQSRLVLVSASVSAEDNERVKNDDFIYAIYEKPLNETALREIFNV